MALLQEVAPACPHTPPPTPPPTSANTPPHSCFPLSKSLTVAELLKGYAGLGLQASHVAQACDIIRKIKKEKTPIYLTLTSNIISSGLREIVAQLCKEKIIAAIITTTGAIEEDLIKTKAPFR